VPANVMLEFLFYKAFLKFQQKSEI